MDAKYIRSTTDYYIRESEVYINIELKIMAAVKNGNFSTETSYCNTRTEELLNREGFTTTHPNENKPFFTKIFWEY